MVQIDFGKRRIALTDAYTVTGAQHVVPFTWWNNLPIVNLTLTLPDDTKVSGRFIVDLGANAAVGVTTPFARAHGMAETLETIAPPPVTEMGGGSRFLVGRMPGLRLGGIQLEDVVIGISANTEGVFASTEVDGLIGSELWRRFNLVLDYANQVIVLEPRAGWNAPFEYDMSGLMLGRDGDVFVAQTVMDTAPAGESGMRAGDRIVRVNGKPSSALTVDEVRNLFKQPGRSVTLVVERAGERLEIAFTTRRLV